jgi:hypothetical protein
MKSNQIDIRGEFNIKLDRGVSLRRYHFWRDAMLITHVGENNLSLLRQMEIGTVTIDLPMEIVAAALKDPRHEADPAYVPALRKSRKAVDAQMDRLRKAGVRCAPHDVQRRIAVRCAPAMVEDRRGREMVEATEFSVTVEDPEYSGVLRLEPIALKKSVLQAAVDNLGHVNLLTSFYVSHALLDKLAEHKPEEAAEFRRHLLQGLEMGKIEIMAAVTAAVHGGKKRERNGRPRLMGDFRIRIASGAALVRTDSSPRSDFTVRLGKDNIDKLKGIGIETREVELPLAAVRAFLANPAEGYGSLREQIPSLLKGNREVGQEIDRIQDRSGARLQKHQVENQVSLEIVPAGKNGDAAMAKDALIKIEVSDPLRKQMVALDEIRLPKAALEAAQAEAYRLDLVHDLWQTLTRLDALDELDPAAARTDREMALGGLQTISDEITHEISRIGGATIADAMRKQSAEERGGDDEADGASA